MPFNWPSAAVFESALLISSAVVFFFRTATKSTTETFGVGHAHRVPVELALEFRHDQADRFCGAGGGRDHVDCRGTSAAQILVREVEHVLIVRVAVNRRHRALLDAELFVQNFHDGSETVRRTRRVRDDVVLGRRRTLSSFTPSTIVTSSFDAGAEMMTFFTLPRRWAFAFVASVKCPVDSTTTCTPRDGQSICAGSFGSEDLDRFAADSDGIRFRLDVRVERTERGVVLQQVRQSLGVSKVVGRYEFDARDCSVRLERHFSRYGRSR